MTALRCMQQMCRLLMAETGPRKRQRPGGGWRVSSAARQRGSVVAPPPGRPLGMRRSLRMTHVFCARHPGGAFPSPRWLAEPYRPTGLHRIVAAPPIGGAAHLRPCAVPSTRRAHVAAAAAVAGATAASCPCDSEEADARPTYAAAARHSERPADAWPRPWPLPLAVLTAAPGRGCTQGANRLRRWVQTA